MIQSETIINIQMKKITGLGPNLLSYFPEIHVTSAAEIPPMIPKIPSCVKPQPNTNAA